MAVLAIHLRHRSCQSLHCESSASVIEICMNLPSLSKPLPAPRGGVSSAVSKAQVEAAFKLRRPVEGNCRSTYEKFQSNLLNQREMFENSPAAHGRSVDRSVGSSDPAGNYSLLPPIRSTQGAPLVGWQSGAVGASNVNTSPFPWPPWACQASKNIP